MSLDTGLKVLHGHDCESLTADSDGVAIDTQGFDEALLILNVGVITATGLLDCTVEEDDAVAMGSATAISGAAFTQVTDALDQNSFIMRIRLGLGRERFMRCVMDQATAAVLCSATWVLLRGHHTLMEVDVQVEV